MNPSSIHVSSKTTLGHLENFLEAARGQTIVIEDKYRKSTRSIRLGVREKDGNSSEHAQDKAKTRQALYQAISTVLESKNCTGALSFLDSLVQASGNRDALFIPDTTQLKPEVLEKLFQNNAVSQPSPPIYKSAVPLHGTDRTFTQEEYLNFPDTKTFGPSPKVLVEKAKRGEFTAASNHPQYSSTFIADLNRMVHARTCTLESLDGKPKICATLTEFIDFCDSGNQENFQSQPPLSIAVSAVLSQNLPIFFSHLILKSASTPIKSAKDEPVFFNPSFKDATFHLKKMPDGGIKITYNGTCRPTSIRTDPHPMAPARPLPQPGLVNMVCDFTISSNGDLKYGDVRIHSEGLNF
jgi:hypothetical protein